MSTSNMCQDIAENYKRKIFRTKIGEANVVETMEKTGAIIGGEGNGGVIYSPVHSCRDSITGIGIILDLMAKENEKISTIVDKIPKYTMRKDKILYSMNLEMLYWKIKNEFQDATINTLDGIRFDWADNSWIHIRPSNTEPIIRIIGEAKNEERINHLFNKVRLTLGEK
jgi:phosphomannomutase